MKKLVAVLFASVIALTPPAVAQTPGLQRPAPTLKIVNSIDKEKGQITFLETYATPVLVNVDRITIVNGQQVTKVVTETTIVYAQRIVTHPLASSAVITPDRKPLPMNEVWNRLKKGSVVALSIDLAVPEAAYLRALSAETLVIVSGLPPSPMPAPGAIPKN